jgi:membrane fusion protein (multidrug efflux system)
MALLLGLLTVVSAGCDRESSAQSRGAVSNRRGSPAFAVRVAPAVVRPAQRAVEVVGTLHGQEEATISAKVAGRIASVHRDMGDRAAPGEPLAQIDRTDYELALRQRELAVREVLAKLRIDRLDPEAFDPESVPSVQKARLESANAEARFNRGKQLHEQRPPLMSDQDFADLRTAWEVAKSSYEVELTAARALFNQAAALEAQVQIARQALSDTTARAPSATPLPATTPSTESLDEQSFAITARLVSVGEYVREGAALLRVVDDDPMKFRASVPERFAAEVRVGQQVVLKVEAYEEQFTGEVTRVNAQVDPANRTFMIEALVPNPGRLLKAGGFARAAIQTRLDPAVVFVPRTAVVQFAGVSRVFTVAPDGTAVEHQVHTGMEDGDLIEIIGGPDGALPVVVEGAARLSGGAHVEVKAPSTGSS